VNIIERVNKILEDKVVSETECNELLDAIKEDGILDDTESAQLERIGKLIDSGEVKLE
jgi:hypothetical protein